MNYDNYDKYDKVLGVELTTRGVKSRWVTWSLDLDPTRVLATGPAELYSIYHDAVLAQVDNPTGVDLAYHLEKLLRKLGDCDHRFIEIIKVRKVRGRPLHRVTVYTGS